MKVTVAEGGAGRIARGYHSINCGQSGLVWTRAAEGGLIFFLSLSPFLRGEGWGEGLSPRMSSIDRPVPPDRIFRCDPTSPRKRGEVRSARFSDAGSDKPSRASRFDRTATIRLPAAPGGRRPRRPRRGDDPCRPLLRLPLTRGAHGHGRAGAASRGDCGRAPAGCNVAAALLAR